MGRQVFPSTLQYPNAGAATQSMGAVNKKRRQCQSCIPLHTPIGAARPCCSPCLPPAWKTSREAQSSRVLATERKNWQGNGTGSVAKGESRRRRGCSRVERGPLKSSRQGLVDERVRSSRTDGAGPSANSPHHPLGWAIAAREAAE